MFSIIIQTYYYSSHLIKHSPLSSTTSFAANFLERVVHAHCLQFLISSSLWITPSYPVPHDSTKTAHVKVTNNLHLANFNGQFCYYFTWPISMISQSWSFPSLWYIFFNFVVIRRQPTFLVFLLFCFFLLIPLCLFCFFSFPHQCYKTPSLSPQLSSLLLCLPLPWWSLPFYSSKCHLYSVYADYSQISISSPESLNTRITYVSAYSISPCGGLIDSLDSNWTPDLIVQIGPTYILTHLG